jgi:histidinol-phosphate aminotransferase
MSAFVPPLRADLANEVPYGAPQMYVPVRLNVNENPFDLPAEIARAMGDAVAAIAPNLNRYPDREAVKLRTELAVYLKCESEVTVTSDQIWAANGSNEILHQLFLAFGGPGRTAISFDPTYSMYPEYARDTFTGYLTFPRCEDFTIDLPVALAAIAAEKPSIVLLTSPNNPTGTALPLAEMIAILEAGLAVNAVVVVDEAYIEFRRSGTSSALELLERFPNLMVSRTMSKAFGLAGARIGYAIASQQLIDALRIVRLPYHLSAVTQVVGVTALQHWGVLQAEVAILRTERDGLSSWLVDQGFTVAPSDANFLLFGKFADRDVVWQSLLDQGVLIRQTGPKGWLRVTIGTQAENDRFKEALLLAPRTEPDAGR